MQAPAGGSRDPTATNASCCDKCKSLQQMAALFRALHYVPGQRTGHAYILAKVLTTHTTHHLNQMLVSP
jgi:hypothetical protein